MPTPTGADHGYLFAGYQMVTIPGTLHGLGTTALHVGVYDASHPAHVVFPESVSIDPATYDVRVAFQVPQDGMVVLNAGLPGLGPTGNYGVPFAPTTTLTIPGSLHALATPTLLVAVYDTSTPRALLAPASITVDPETYDVVVTFNYAQPGFVVLCGYMGTGGTPNSLVALPGTPSVTLTEAAHSLETAHLLVERV